MKILMTSETYLPRIGGAEIHVTNLFSRLKKAGHNVILVTNEEGSTEDGVVRIGWNKKRIVYILRTLWDCSTSCDLIHSHYCHRFAFLVGIIARMRGIPLVITLHGMGILDHPGMSFLNRLSHSMYRYWSLQFATTVISTSEDLAIVAYKYIKKEKIIVILNGYDAELFSSTKLSTEVSLSDNLFNKKIILTVRRLVPKNGIQYLIEAIPFILKKEKNFHYFIVGDGSLKESIGKRINELGIGAYVTMLGMKDNKDVVSYLALADVVVFPSTAESSSIACAEAMGMRKMIVASKVGGLVELLGSNQERGLLVNLVPWQGSNYDAPRHLPVAKYEILADCVIDALNLSQENIERKQRAQEYALKELSWDSIFKKTVVVYDALLSKKK